MMDEQPMGEPDSMHILVKDHLNEPPKDECGYCSQAFGPDEVVIERRIHGVRWRFCSEECYRDYLKASDFADEDLDSTDAREHPENSEDIADDSEEP